MSIANRNEGGRDGQPNTGATKQLLLERKLPGVLTRSVDTLSIAVQGGQQRWKRQTPAMAAQLTDHIWTTKELLMTVVPPHSLKL